MGLNQTGQTGQTLPGESAVSPVEATASASAAPDSRSSRLPIVGIGTSAGGLDALKELFTAMPEQTGIGFVVVPHHDPNHDSLMVELLARHTGREVVSIEDGMPVRPDRIHVVPPNSSLTIRNGVLRLDRPVERRGVRMPIDHFFASLAEDQEDRAIGVILTGTGTDGAHGVKIIKTQGGMTIAQDPATAQYQGMPLSAIGTGTVDCVLPISHMPAAILDYVRHDQINCESLEGQNGDEERGQEFNGILATLRTATGYDFRHYKKKTLNRRIQRRMSLRGLHHLAEYGAQLANDPEEVRLLFRDLLIGVTQFFREAEAWRCLQEIVFPSLVREARPGMSIRVWVPGCATGEEAYSVAMLLREEAEAQQKNCGIQVFATDIDIDALEYARLGLYPESVAADISPERLARFFTREGNNYQVVKELRELVVFAPQNLITDPPFSKLDLISCRNVLIYVEPEMQQRIIALFHFALKPDGYLLLGHSESIGPREDLFRRVAKTCKLYRRIGTARRDPLEFPALAPEQGASPPRFVARAVTPRTQSLADLTHQVLLQQFAPASILTNRLHQALYFFGPTQNYISQPTGERTDNLLELAAEELRPKLRAALYKATNENQPVTVTGARLTRGDETVSVRISVTPIRVAGQEADLLLVTFLDETAPATIPPAAVEWNGEDAAVLRHLEDELRTTREELRSTIDEMDAWNEELKASNEEIMSMNEELQSTNEELEASKEELQSLNEELSTVNSQLQDKVEALEQANNDLSNLLVSTHIATLFVDPALRIKKFTPASAKLVAPDLLSVGQSLAHIAQVLPDPDLVGDARRVLDELAPIRREIQSQAGHWFIRRVLPYRTHDNRIEGVVVTLTDVTDLKEAEHALRASERRFRAMSDAAPVMIWMSGPDGRRTYVNKSWLEFTGRTQEQEQGEGWMQGIHPEDLSHCRHIYGRAFDRRETFTLEYRLRRNDGEHRWILDHGVPLYSPDGEFTGSIGSCLDITDRKRAEDVLRHSERELRVITDSVPSLIGYVDAERRYRFTNAAYQRWFGLSPEQIRGTAVWEVLGESAYRAILPYIDAALAGQECSWEQEVEYRYGGRRYVQGHFMPNRDAQGQVVGYYSVISDVTGLRAAERDQARLAAIVRTSGDAIMARDLSGGITTWNAGAERMYGYRAEEVLGRPLDELVPPELQTDSEAMYQRAFQGEEIRSLHTVRLRKDGKPLNISITLSPIRDAAGQLIGVSSIHRDITEQVRIQRLLWESEERLQLAARATNDAVWDWDLRSGRVTWNDAAYKLFGHDVSAVGTDIAWRVAHIHPDDREQITSSLQRALDQRIDSWQADYRFRRADGSYADVFDRAYVVRDHQGQPLRVIGAMVDMTERKAVLQQLQELNETLEERVAERTALAEQRTAQLRALAAQITQTEQRERRRLAVMLHDHIQQLLVAAKMKAGTIQAAGDELIRQPLTELNEYLQQAIDASRTLAVDLSPPVLHDAGLVAALHWLSRRMRTQYGLTVETAVETEAAPTDEDLKAFLLQAIRELLFNIVKHAGVMYARVTLKQHGDDLRIVVEDRGRGFDPALLDQRLAESEGFGLLSIRERLDVLGGRLEIGTLPGHGTRVSLQVPLHLPSEQQTVAAKVPVESEAEPPPATEPPERTPDTIRVLLVDDHRIVRAGLAGLLRHQPGIEIVGEASDGEEAVQRTRELQPDVVVMDVTMPKLNGIEATKQIKQQMPQVTVIGLSLHESENMATAMREAGASDYLTKGGPAEDLINAIRQCRAT